MDKNIQQIICFIFCIANGISCTQSLKKLQEAYGESTLTKTRAYEWYSAFKTGRDVVEDLPHSGRPSTSSIQVNIAKVKEKSLITWILFGRFKAFERVNSLKKGRFVERNFLDFALR